MGPRYSICITHYNEVRTIEASLQSILSQIDQDFEIVVVDNNSNDGSEDVLMKYAKEGRVRLFVSRVRNRGIGRQVAFEGSRGNTVLANLDLDDVYRPRLKQILSWYDERCEGTLLWARSTDPRSYWGGGNLTIAPRNLLLHIGGWRDLQYGEDWELARRAAGIGRYRWTRFELLQEPNPHPERERSLAGKFRFRYGRYRDMLRCGRNVFNRGESISVSQRVPYVLARFAVSFTERYHSEDHSFDPYGEKYFLPYDVSKVSAAACGSEGARRAELAVGPS